MQQDNYLMKKLNLLIGVFLFLVVPLAMAVDKSGKFVSGGGVGGHSCPFFISIMDEAKKHGLGSRKYALGISAQMNYILGFQTGYNLQANDTCDIFGGYELDQIFAWLYKYCQDNSLEKFGGAVVSLSLILHDSRVRSCQ